MEQTTSWRSQNFKLSFFCLKSHFSSAKNKTAAKNNEKTQKYEFALYFFISQNLKKTLDKNGFRYYNIEYNIFLNLLYNRFRNNTKGGKNEQ